MNAGKRATRAGDTLAGRYRLDRHLGDDGSAEIYSATDGKLGSQVHVRLLRPEHALQPREIESFASLPRALLTAAAPHLVRVFDVSSDDTGIPFVVEEPTAGRSLAELLDEHPNGLSVGETCRIVGPVIEALARLHMAGVVHGRIDPRRILLVPHGADVLPRLVHFKAVEGGGAVGTGMAVYRAPEARVAGKALDPAMDVWAIGTLLHQCLSGKVPPPQASAARLKQTLPASVPDALVELLAEMLQVDVEERLTDAAVIWMRSEQHFANWARVASLAPAANTNGAVQSNPPVAAPAFDSVSVASLFPAGLSIPPPTANQAQPAADALAAVAAELASKSASVTALVARPLPQVQATPAAAPADAPRVLKAAPLVAMSVRSAGLAVAEADSLPPKPLMPSRDRAPGKPRDTGQDEAFRKLIGLGDRKESQWWLWARRFAVLLLLLLLYFAVPVMHEPDLATARRVFGPKLQIAAVVMAAVTVVAMVRTWAIAAKGNVLLLRPVVYAFAAVAVCIVAIIVGGFLSGFGDPEVVDELASGGRRFGGGGVRRVLFNGAQQGLPYSVLLLLLLGAFYGLMDGVRSLRDGAAAAVASMLLAALAVGAAGDIALTVIKPELQDVLEARRQRREAGEDESDEVTNIENLKHSFGPKVGDVHEMDPGDGPGLTGRTSSGDGSEVDQLMDDMNRQRSHQQDLIKATEDDLPPLP